MPDDPSAASNELAALREVNARLRAANARLRAVVEAKDLDIAALRAALETGQARQAEVIRRLELRVAELERRAGMDSGNSSVPPSKDSLAAKARQKAARRASLRERSTKRRPGGQPGHPGSGLEPERDPDRTEQAEPPAQCRCCGAGLAGAEPAGRGWGQVWDIPPVRLEKVHWLLPKLRCAACGAVTTADLPGGRAGTVVYGPNVNAATILMNSEGNVPAERTAALLAALLGAPVSDGFVARAHQRLAQQLEEAGFDEAMKAALRAEQALCRRPPTGGRPCRGRSASPASPSLLNRPIHRRTVAGWHSSSPAIWAAGNPCSDSSTITARTARRHRPRKSARNRSASSRLLANTLTGCILITTSPVGDIGGNLDPTPARLMSTPLHVASLVMSPRRHRLWAKTGMFWSSATSL